MAGESSDDQYKNLRMEYEQTAQTLRNWDTLFFQCTSNIILGGGISTAVVVFRDSGDLKVRLFALLIASLLEGLVLLYFGYSYFVARRKIEVLRKIEVKLELAGVYGASHSGSQRTFWIALAATLVAYLVFVFLTLGRASFQFGLQ